MQKSVVIIMSIFFLFLISGCGDTINNYYIVSDGEAIPCPDNDCESIIHPDNDGAVETDSAVDDDIFQIDSDQEMPDSIDGTDENEDSDFVEQPDSDIVIDYCENMVDKNNESMERDYSNGDNPTDTKTILTIKLQPNKKSCLIKLSSTSISSLNGFSVEATAMPIKKRQIVFEEKNCYLYIEFISNKLTIQIMEISTLDLLVNKSFFPK